MVVDVAEEDEVSTRRLAEIMLANFVAAAFVSSPIGISAWYVAGADTRWLMLAIMLVGWPISWGLFSAGRSWQRRREDVLFPEPLGRVMDAIGINGEAEKFADLLYMPGVQVPDCKTVH